MADSMPEHLTINAEPTDVAYFNRLVEEGQVARAKTPPPDVSTLRGFVRSFSDSPLAHLVPEDIDVSPVQAGGVSACWFAPRAICHPAPLIYFHGGGFVCGSVYGERGVAALIARKFGAPVLAVGYRQAPEHPYPAANEDAWTAYEWLAAQTEHEITLVGNSAGGGLAIEVAIRAARAKVGRPRGAIATSAWFDLSMSGESWQSNRQKDIVAYDAGLLFRRMYLGAEEAAVGPAIADDDLQSAPPLLVQMGANEMALDDASAFVTRARTAGCSIRYEVYAEMPHNFIKYAAAISECAVGRMKAWEISLPCVHR